MDLYRETLRFFPRERPVVGPPMSPAQIEDILDDYVDSAQTTVVAGEYIGGGKVVMLDGGLAYNYDTSNLTHYSKAIGISNQAVNIGEDLQVITSGECNQMGGLYPGEPYFASTGGNVSLTPVVTGISQVVGVAETATSIIVNLQKPYIKI